jgi:hypothetical protein
MNPEDRTVNPLELATNSRQLGRRYVAIVTLRADVAVRCLWTDWWCEVWWENACQPARGCPPTHAISVASRHQGLQPTTRFTTCPGT